VRLLFDENLSPKLVEALGKEYPGSLHVRSVGLRGAEDTRIWGYAREHRLTIVSKDNDFRQRSFLEGSPPKVVWLEVGNAGTAAIAETLQRERGRLLAFEAEAESALLVVSLFVRAV
jgi:predicted nuclease of predicted toxin-antitoxin system